MGIGQLYCGRCIILIRQREYSLGQTIHVVDVMITATGFWCDPAQCRWSVFSTFCSVFPRPSAVVSMSRINETNSRRWGILLPIKSRKFEKPCVSTFLVTVKETGSWLEVPSSERCCNYVPVPLLINFPHYKSFSSLLLNWLHWWHTCMIEPHEFNFQRGTFRAETSCVFENDPIYF